MGRTSHLRSSDDCGGAHAALPCEEAGARAREELTTVLHMQNDFARYTGWSLRKLMYLNAFDRHRLIDGQGRDRRQIRQGWHGFLVEICRLGDTSAQQVVNELVPSIFLA